MCCCVEVGECYVVVCGGCVVGMVMLYVIDLLLVCLLYWCEGVVSVC